MSENNKALYRIEVFYKIPDSRGETICKKLQTLGFSTEKITISDNYLINAELTNNEAESVAELLIQPVAQVFSINTPYMPESFDYCIEIGFLPGVTDNIANTVRESIEDLLHRPLDREKSVFSTISYYIKGFNSREEAGNACAEFYNPLIQRSRIFSRDEYKKNNGFGYTIPLVSISEKASADVVNLNVDDTELAAIGKDGIKESNGSRRGPLALDMLSMNVIRKYFTEKEKRNPTDIELESIAQTWSEHCKHTIFASAIDDDTPEGIYRTYIKEATKKIRRDKGDKDFCISVFTDNSGGIEFNDDYIISDKVETHNSPSALDPFGGAITGIVGVNRDSIGFGIGAKPVANRYGFCFAPPGDESPLYKNKSPESKLLPPRRIMEGVIHGVNAGGNTSGIPTPQGFIYFDKRYKGKPLVFVGTIGLMPKNICGKSSVVKNAVNGDAIIMTGGRVGRDGIHGATFSSEALSSGSPATAVQIGDPITQKKLSDAIIKEARDLGLYNSITDNGAGGLSCSVAEMARESGGFEVELDKVPLKYPGLSPWQIWISESQERMTLSIPENKVTTFIHLMKRRGVEATVIGRFTASGRGIVRYNGKEIFNIDLDFLHDGLPKRSMDTEEPQITVEKVRIDEPSDHKEIFHKMISRLNTCSFEFISTQYDHEVQAGSVIKPLQGKGRVNGNVSVIRPLLDSWRGVVLSQGLYPSYSEINPYRMAACSIDTAVRNAVSAGASLDHLALLDNFCWCDSNNPQRLWQLKKASAACYDYAVAYGTPYISGKDSMFNDFRGYNADFEPVEISIPPTLLISSIGVMKDIRKAMSVDFKVPGDIIYLVGSTLDETGCSEYNALAGEIKRGNPYMGSNVPSVDTEKFIEIYRKIENTIDQSLLSSCISIERGGLGVAAAKSGIAGLSGFEIDLSKVPAPGKYRNDILLYSESQGRFLVSVNPGLKAKFEECMKGSDFSELGVVRNDRRIIFKATSGSTIIDTDVETADSFYREPLNKY
ncbi:MAG TPA: AIR synthase-related protein [Spirochaetota bacterium]|nr:AIR synthase-related protein [Spirochaetota bacterium]